MYQHPLLPTKQAANTNDADLFTGSIVVNDKPINVVNNYVTKPTTQLQTDLVAIINKSITEKRYFTTEDNSYVVIFYSDTVTENGEAMDLMLRFTYPKSYTWISQLMFEQGDVETAMSYRERLAVSIRPAKTR